MALEPDIREWHFCNKVPDATPDDAPLLALLPGFLRADDATAIQNTLEREIEWRSPTLRFYGREHTIPRSQCWMGDDDASYRYSGRTLQAQPWHPTVLELRDCLVSTLQSAGLPSAAFNSVLLNRYAHGDQRMGWHSDDEPELGIDPIIAAVSLGSERPLRFREKARTSRAAFNVWLPHGSLLLMGPGAQSRWQHALAPRAVPGARINLTFRQVF